MTELWMPKQRTDEVGTFHDGPVLSGEKSVEERRNEVTRSAVRRDGEFYGSVEDYDPVLRAHCRL